jgi:hypothetical protein
MMQSSDELRSKRTANPVRNTLAPARLVQRGRSDVRSTVLGAALACGLAAVVAAPVSAASEGFAGQHGRTVAKAPNASAASASFKANPDTKSKTAKTKATHADKKKATRTAHTAPKKDHDNTKVAKADKKRASDDSIGTSDDPLEGL